MKNILPLDGEMALISDFLEGEEAQALFEELLQKVQWERKTMIFYEKEVALPRLTAWFGDNNKEYKYSGILNQTQPWLPELLSLKELIKEKLGLEFNSCLLNLYRDGKDHVSWHSDNEKELGTNPTILSLSLGQARSFQIKHKFIVTDTIKLDLKSGDVVIMRGPMQRNWLHRLAPTSKKVGARINITFRNVSFN